MTEGQLIYLIPRERTDSLPGSQQDVCLENDLRRGLGETLEAPVNPARGVLQVCDTMVNESHTVST